MRHQEVSKLGFAGACFTKEDSELVFATLDETVIDSGSKISEHKLLVDVHGLICV